MREVRRALRNRILGLALAVTMSFIACGCGEDASLSGSRESGRSEAGESDNFDAQENIGAGTESGGHSANAENGPEGEAEQGGDTLPTQQDAAAAPEITNGWDGTWEGDGVTVRIAYADAGEGYPYVHVSDGNINDTISNIVFAENTMTADYFHPGYEMAFNIELQKGEGEVTYLCTLALETLADGSNVIKTGTLYRTQRE